MRICQPPEKEEQGASNSSVSKPSPCSTFEMRASISYPPAAAYSDCAASRHSSSSSVPRTHDSTAESSAALAAWYLSIRETTYSRTVVSAPDTAVCSSMPSRSDDDTTSWPPSASRPPPPPFAAALIARSSVDFPQPLVP